MESDTPFVSTADNHNVSELWYYNPKILFREDRLSYFFPTKNLSVVENMNAIVRLSIYVSIILIIYSKDAFYLWLPLVCMLLTVIIYYFYPNKEMLSMDITYGCPKLSFEQEEMMSKLRDQEINQSCVRPTVDNPFMNFNYITDDYKKPPACKSYTEDTKDALSVRKEIKNAFNYNLYRDVSDLYGKRNSQREFFTMPWTSWPNNQTAFAKWCFRTGPTCKELGLKCAPFWNPYASYSKLEDSSS